MEGRIIYMGWEEKRQYKRAYIRLSVEVRSKSCWQYVEAADISAGGMFVITEKTEPVQTRVEALFDFGTEGKKRFIYAEGMVVWVRGTPETDKEAKTLPAGMGVKFTKFVPLTAKEFIDRIASTS
jgi:c-di-GMP-binding flagellar brake protein YcgR